MRAALLRRLDEDTAASAGATDPRRWAVSRSLCRHESAILDIRRRRRLRADVAVGRSDLAGGARALSIAPGSRGRAIGRKARFPQAKTTIRWSASRGTKRVPLPAGPASGCRRMPEWVKAGGWPVFVESRSARAAALSVGRIDGPPAGEHLGQRPRRNVPVQSFQRGQRQRRRLQLVGNVWEWTSSSFGAWEPAGRKIETDMPLKSIRGGAFDTYFETQAHSQFQSGDGPLDRKHNIGFRCAWAFAMW